MSVETSEPNEQFPQYRKVEEGKSGKTKTFMIVRDEGWKESILCEAMYEADADWLIEQILRSHGRATAFEKSGVPKTFQNNVG